MKGRLSRDQRAALFFILPSMRPSPVITASMRSLPSWISPDPCRTCHLLLCDAVGGLSIDPMLVIRMLILGRVFAPARRRAICPEERVNPAFRRFCCVAL